MNAAEAARAQSYRWLAAKCREMAEHTRRSGSLRNRADVFDEIAADIELGHASLESGGDNI